MMGKAVWDVLIVVSESSQAYSTQDQKFPRTGRQKPKTKTEKTKSFVLAGFIIGQRKHDKEQERRSLVFFFFLVHLKYNSPWAIPSYVVCGAPCRTYNPDKTYHWKQFLWRWQSAGTESWPWNPGQAILSLRRTRCKDQSQKIGSPFPTARYTALLSQGQSWSGRHGLLLCQLDLGNCNKTNKLSEKGKKELKRRKPGKQVRFLAD